MQLHGTPVLNYKVTDSKLNICVAAASMEDAKALVSVDMMLQDDSGNDFLLLNGFCDIERVTFVESLKAFELEVRRKTEAELQISKLQKENDTLREQLENAIKSNEMLEECIVEMAGIVYA